VVIVRVVIVRVVIVRVVVVRVVFVNVFVAGTRNTSRDARAGHVPRGELS
jgi:hypothetical protein